MEPEEENLVDIYSSAYKVGSLAQEFEDYRREKGNWARFKSKVAEAPRNKYFGRVLAALAIILICFFAVWYALLLVATAIVSFVLHQLVHRSIGIIAEHAYMLRIVRFFHVDALTCMLTCGGESYWHSRFADVRCDVPLNGKSRCSIHAIPQLEDNICYLVVEHDTARACLVDASHAASVIAAVSEISTRLFGNETVIVVEAVLTTHKHWDHSGANELLAEHFASNQFCIYGHEKDNVLGCTHPLKDGEKFTVGDNLTWEVLHVPCHTKGSVMYLLKGHENKDVLMAGDTVFHGTCGALFEGTRRQMINNYATIVERCSPNTLIFPGHDAASSILDIMLQGFAATSLNPGEFLQLAGQLFTALHRRYHADNLMSIPIRLDEERITNPVFRALTRHQRFVTQAIRKFQVRTEDPSNIQLNIRTSVSRATSGGGPVVGARVTHDTSRIPFVTVYGSEFVNLQEMLREEVITCQEAARELQRMRENIFENVNKDRMAKNMKMELNSSLVILASHAGWRYEQKEELPGNWINRAKLLSLVGDCDPRMAQILGQQVWAKGEFVPVQLLSLFLEGKKEMAANLPAATLINKSDDKSWACKHCKCSCVSHIRELLQGINCRCRPSPDRYDIPEPKHNIGRCNLCSRNLVPLDDFRAETRTYLE